MPISKEEDKIHKALMKSQAKILNKMAQIEMDMHKHHGIYGGSIDFIGGLKNLGNTIKGGFEDVGNTIKSGFEDEIINPVKKSEEFDFITKKKGGLASSLLHNGLPAATSALVGGVTGLATGNPLLGMAGSTAGGYAGKELSDYIGRKTGVGLKSKAKKKKYYYSSSSDSDKDFRPKRRTKNSSLQQLLVANKDKEEKELKKSQLLINRHLAEEVKAIRGMRGPPPRVSGYGINKLGDRTRGIIVSEIMKNKGLTLSQASKHVKEHGLY